MELHNQVDTTEGLMMHRLLIFKLVPVILLHLFEAVIESPVFYSATPKDDSILLTGNCAKTCCRTEHELATENSNHQLRLPLI